MILLVAEFYNSQDEKLIDVNLHNITSIKSNDNVQSDKTSISWGVLSNEGSLNFVDKDGSILTILNQEKEYSNIYVKIFITNTLSNKREQISEKYVSNITPNSETKKISVSVKDDLEEWQKININGFDYKTETSKPMTAKDFYLYLSSLTPSKFNMCEFSLLDYRTQEVLQNTIISYPMLKASTLWQAWDKLAKAVGLHILKQMYLNDENKLVSTTIATIDYSVYGA